MNKFAKWALAGLVLAAAAVPAMAVPITVAPGNDGFKTPATGTKIDLSVFPINTFFGLGAVVNPTIVPLTGAPLTGALGSIDTLLERYPPSVTFNLIPETHTFSVEIKGLRLKGQTTIDGLNYNLVVALSETPSGPGTITATRLTPDGGRFNSSFPVLPKLVFTEIGNPANQVVIDCGLVAGCPAPLTLNASNVCWEVAFGPNNFDPATKGITPIAAGIGVDGTFNGVNEYTTVGRKRAGFAGLAFHIGYIPSPPWGLCGGTGTSQHDHAVYSLTHTSAPANDCPPTQTGTGTGAGSSSAVATPTATALACPAVVIQPVDKPVPIEN
ncbi:MAG TPA: hypothetical protein VKK31_30215 [Thermoanaerobaculia bacterium]|nr:hypothetical protein [Thermoanaerobaculia bacterium]